MEQHKPHFTTPALKEKSVDKTQFGFLEVPKPGDMLSQIQMKNYARGFAKMAMDNLAAICDSTITHPAIRVMAAKEILDRAYGKATEEISIREAPKSNVDLSRLSQEELDQLQILRAKMMIPEIQSEYIPKSE